MLLCPEAHRLSTGKQARNRSQKWTPAAHCLKHTERRDIASGYRCRVPAGHGLMVRWFSQEKSINRWTKTKFMHEGEYAAELEAELIDDDTDWSPYMSVEDAYKLDNLRDGLQKGDLKAASCQAKVYELKPVAN